LNVSISIKTILAVRQDDIDMFNNVIDVQSNFILQSQSGFNLSNVIVCYMYTD